MAHICAEQSDLGHFSLQCDPLLVFGNKRQMAIGENHCLQIEADTKGYATASLARRNPNTEFLPNQPGAK